VRRRGFGGCDRVAASSEARGLQGAGLVGAWFGRREYGRREAGWVLGASCVAGVLVGARRGVIAAASRVRGARRGLIGPRRGW
jgi:hypothetical protein